MAGYPPLKGSTLSQAELSLLTSCIQVSITHPEPESSAQVAVTGQGTTNLVPPTGFVQLLNVYSEVLNAGPGFSVEPDGRVRVNSDVLIKVDAYADIKHSVNNSTVGAAFSILRNETLIYSARSVHTRMPNAGDIGHLSGIGVVQALKDDVIGIGLASDLSGNITVRTSSVVFVVVRLG